MGWIGWLSNSLSCRSWLKSGLGWHWLASWEVEAGVVRLRVGGSTAAGLLNWGVKLPTEWPLPCIIWELLIGLGPWVDITLDSLSRCWFVTWTEAICPGS